jgi:hypothetical protein
MDTQKDYDAWSEAERNLKIHEINLKAALQKEMISKLHGDGIVKSWYEGEPLPVMLDTKLPTDDFAKIKPVDLYDMRPKGEAHVTNIPHDTYGNSIQPYNPYKSGSDPYAYTGSEEVWMFDSPAKSSKTYEPLVPEGYVKEEENCILIDVDKLAQHLALKELAKLKGMAEWNENSEGFSDDEYTEVYDRLYDEIYSFRLKK